MTHIFQMARLALALLALATVAGCGLSSDPQRLIAKAQEYRQKSDYKAATIEIKNVLQKNPEHAEARYLLGMTYNDAGDFRSGEQELRRALELHYDQAKVIPALGKSLLMTGQLQQVLDQIRLEGDVNNPVQAQVLTLRGMALIGLGRTREGRELLEQALAKRPEFSDALVGQALLAAGETNLEEAATLIERAIANEPKSAEAWLLKGDLARLAGSQARAVAAYQKVLEFSPSNLRAHISIASLQIADGKLDEARKQIAQIRKVVPNNLTANYLQALVEIRERNYAAARNTVLQVLKVAPDHLPSMLLAGTAEAALGSHSQAQAYLVRVLERAPNNLLARKVLIASLARSGQVQRAIEALQLGLKQAPEDGPLLILAGELYMQSGENEKAEGYFQKAAKQDPKDASARTKLGMSRLASGDVDRALADLESAALLDSSQYQADILLVMSHLQRSNYDEALSALRKLEEKQPNNPLTYNLKAAIYLGKKDTASARKYFERALELEATYVPAMVNLVKLDLTDKNPQGARRRLEAFLEKDKDKDSVKGLIALATFAPQIGATRKEQIDWLERARKTAPRLIQPLLMLARVYAEVGDRKKALETAEQALAISPEDPQVLATLGAAQIGVGQKEQAQMTYSKLVALQPKSPAALTQLAKAQAVSGNQGAAAATLKKSLLLKPDFIDAQVMLFSLELGAKHYAEAMKIAKQVQKQSAKSPVGFVLEGDVSTAEKKFPQAIKAYEAAYDISKFGVLAIKLHNAYTQAGKPDDGDARLAQWIKESPDDAVARLYAADLEMARGRYRQAIVHYEWFQQKQPENVVALNNLAWAYQQVKDPRALETSERAYKLKPDSAAITDTLGWILVEQGNTKRGIELLQKAVTNAPKAPTIRYHLAQAWLKVGDKSKARDELERLLSTDDKFPQRAEAVTLLKQLKN